MDNFSLFNTAAYPSLTTAYLTAKIEAGTANDVMIAEVSCRALRDAGDVSVMTPGERLHRAA